MKIKTDYVTNSSSSSFIVGLVNNRDIQDLRNFVKKLNKDPMASNEGVSISALFKDINELNDYTNDGPYDWASKPRGLQFRNLCEETYEICKRYIETHGNSAIVSIDYNVFDKFQDEYAENGEYNPDY